MSRTHVSSSRLAKTSASLSNLSFSSSSSARARIEEEEEKGNPDAKMKGIGDQDQKDLQDLDGKDESLVGLVARLRDASSAYDRKKRAFDKLVDCNEVDLEGLVALLGPNNLDGSFFEFAETSWRRTGR